jgi:hypothetical protein
MLSDAHVERYARQVVLPEVGGRGQERLLASRVVVLGHGSASRRASDLLRRAGVQVVADDPPGEPPTVIVDLRTDAGDASPAGDRALLRGRVHGTTATLTVHPSGPDATQTRGYLRRAAAVDPLAVCGLHALAALAATETLLLLLGTRHTSRRYTIDLHTGTCAATPGS